MLMKLMLSRNVSYDNHDNQETRTRSHGNSDLVYTVDSAVEYDYATEYAVTPHVTHNLQVEDGKCHIVEATEEQTSYEFVFDNNKYENREIASERKNTPIDRHDVVDIVAALNENPVCGTEISKFGNKIGSLKKGSQVNQKPTAGNTNRMNLVESELQSVRQQLRSTKSPELKPSNSVTNSVRGEENMGFVQDTDDLYEEVGQAQEHLSKQGQHRRPPLPALPNADRNQPIHDNDPSLNPQVKANTPKVKQTIYDNTVDDSNVQVPMSFVPNRAHHGMCTGSSKDAPGLLLDIRYLEDDERNSKGDSEPIYGNATLADLAISLNEAVENRRKPRRKTGGETSDGDRSWWTDDQWSA